MEIIKIIKDSKLVEGKKELEITPDTDPKSIVHVNPVKMVERKDVNLGGWYVDIDLLLKDKEHVDQDYIVLVDTKSKGIQPFRMHNKEVTSRRVKVRARHVLYDTELYAMSELEVEKMSTSGVMERIQKRLDRESPYTFVSTHTNPITYKFEPMSLFDALSVIVNDKGARLDIDWYTIYLRDDLGEDRGVTVSYGKDLEDIRGFEEWDHVATKIYPIGDGEVELPGKYVESDVKYPREYTKVVEFSLDMGKKENSEGEEVDWSLGEKQDKLKRLAESYLTKHKYPKVAYQVTSNIKEDINLWDTVIVKHPSLTYNLPLSGPVTEEMEEKLGIPIRVLAYEYDVIAKRTTKLEYGDFSVRTDSIFKNKLDEIQNSIQKDINNKVGDVSETFEERLKEQTDLINNWNKKGHMVIMENEILFLDKLPIEEARNVLKIGLGGISFSETGVDGNFTSAWDLKGNFNTDFIGAGQIKTNHLSADVGASLDITSNKSINMIVEDMKTLSHNKNLIKNLGGTMDTYEYWTWTGNNVMHNYPGAIYRGNMRANTNFEIVELTDTLSKRGLSFYSYGEAVSGYGHVVPDSEYSFRCVRVRGDQVLSVSVREYDSDLSYIKRTRVTFDNDKVHEFTFKPQANTSYVDLILSTTGVDYDNRLVISDLMFTRGKPKEWQENPEEGRLIDKAWTSAQLKVVDEKVESTVEDLQILDGRVIENSTKFTQLSNKFVLKATSNGSLALVELGADADKGSNFNVKADNITLEGYTTINDGFTIDNLGNMSAKNAFIEGRVEADEGHIGNFRITEGGLRTKIENSHMTIGLVSGRQNVFDFMTNNRLSFGIHKKGYAEISDLRFSEMKVRVPGGSPVTIALRSSSGGIQGVSFDNVNDIMPTTARTTNIGTSYRRFNSLYLDTHPNVSSDVRIKKSIKDVPEDFLRRMANISPREYVKEGKVHFGYLAQDVERELYKYCLDKYGRDNAYKAMENYAFLYKDESYMSLLYGEISVIKDAVYKSKVEELENRIRRLEEIIKKSEDI